MKAEPLTRPSLTVVSRSLRSPVRFTWLSVRVLRRCYCISASFQDGFVYCGLTFIVADVDGGGEKEGGYFHCPLRIPMTLRYNRRIQCGPPAYSGSPVTGPWAPIQNLTLLAAATGRDVISLFRRILLHNHIIHSNSLFGIK